MRLLIAASGTGGHLFPALAVAEHLEDCQIDWLGVPNRLETELVKDKYPLHQIQVEGFQSKLSLESLRIAQRLVSSIGDCRRLLKDKQIQAVFTTGGYIAAPIIIAAKSLGIPVLLHESNALPGKVARLFAPWCHTVAIGFAAAQDYLKGTRAVCVGTPVREQFFHPQPLTLDIPDDAPLILVIGGSQGAVAVNQLVRACVTDWLARGCVVVHLTGNNDPDANSVSDPRYITLPFYDNVAALLERATLAVSRSGAGTLTELAISRTPAILIPYPYAADNHQARNADSFVGSGAARAFSQSELTSEQLNGQVLELLGSPETLQTMAAAMASLAVPDSAEQIANLLVQMAIA
ncbi:undecaprenyldiphospho-muramoylpentapeptide beta-N-acetylglucosaminyltransferase [Roseofilum casamattae]|uniref:UDP-N-acetylglucosamine--N-acetylmuramyl-(pentapeptide) pyrophosphoryl-undecaprenol N-acetylglucosamine transferase n=1 Tax=Roseofilum casamattae BLCC-M143 TaxID=3022442 RepID=A0ABT7C1J8_9CYAN|nr:undecaprenyldiphospho-muramoylpentapeptide beta-N-acetylglucosaminyltransferase [Roseofilum casamattae]MDJ1185327.1 undecaprenyldiphospho-muramoylpentapeptide beta-N-acetylglucosaminyltransferase [Roseofilum casamattae BLCC-M143]